MAHFGRGIQNQYMQNKAMQEGYVDNYIYIKNTLNYMSRC